MSEVTVKELFGALNERRERIKALECESNSRAYQLRRCNEKQHALLDAAKRILKTRTPIPEKLSDYVPRHEIDNLRAAIAKAEGGGE